VLTRNRRNNVALGRGDSRIECNSDCGRAVDEGRSSETRLEAV
jgi:hypothetical protein